MNARYRIARRLLGYAPLRLPDADGVYIVTRQGAFTATIAASSFHLEMAHSPLRFNHPADEDDWSFTPGATSGTFTGTIGPVVASMVASPPETPPATHE